jgi:hypothetical protein
VTVLFKITCSWTKHSQSFVFLEEEYEDVTPLFLALEHFLSVYEGKFVLQVGDLSLYFDLRPDLSTIFEDVLDVLESLTQETQTPAKIYFYEQGTDITLLLLRAGTTITIELVKGPSVGKQFAQLPDTPLSVWADMFLKEWVQFLQTVLNALVALQPELVNDESYQEYFDRLVCLEAGS